LNKIKPSHDKLATRLTQRLIKLNQGEKLSPAELAKEFDVSLRTIQRDLNERLVGIVKRDQTKDENN